MPHVIVLLLLLLVCGCNTRHHLIDFPEIKQVKVKIIGETFVSVPLEMEKKENMIYISDFRSDSLLWRYDLNDFKKVGRLLPRGEGPDEFLSPIQFFFSDSVLFVYNRWHFYGKKYLFNRNDFSIKPISPLIHYSADIDMIYPLSDNRWIASGRFEDCRYIIMDDKGNIISRTGDYPAYQEGEKDIPNFPKFMFHQSMFGFNDSISRLVSITNHVFELWDYSNDELYLYTRKLLSPYEYKYDVGEDWAIAQSVKNIEKGVKRIYATENYIYLLYDLSTEGMLDEKDCLNSEIWVFDWEGMPVQKIEIDANLNCFCVDEQLRDIYCVLNAPEPSIGYFKF